MSTSPSLSPRLHPANQPGMILQQILLISLLPISHHTLTLTYASLLPRVPTIYTPENWSLPHNLNYTPQYTIARPSPSSITTFAYCIRTGGTIPSNPPRTEHSVTETCTSRLDAMGPTYESATRNSGPCIRFGDTTRGSPRTGFWPSRDINCVLFHDTACRYRVNEVAQPAVVLRHPGVDDLSHGWWQERSGAFRDLDVKVGGLVPGPRSARCFWRGPRQVGLSSKEPGVEGAKGL